MIILLSKHVMKHAICFCLIVAGLSLAVSGCKTPLEVDVDRIETPLTPAPKVTPRSIETSFSTADGTYEIVGIPVIEVDTTVNPMRFWVRLEFANTNASLNPLIERFRVNLDSSASNGLVQNLSNGEVRMQMDVGNGFEWFDADPTTNTASVLIGAYEAKEGEPRTATITVYLIGNQNGFFPGLPQQQILGTITVVI